MKILKKYIYIIGHSKSHLAEDIYLKFCLFCMFMAIFWILIYTSTVSTCTTFSFDRIPSRTGWKSESRKWNKILSFHSSIFSCILKNLTFVRNSLCHHFVITLFDDSDKINYKQNELISSKFFPLFLYFPMFLENNT